MLAHQKAKQDMQRVARKEPVSAADLLNIRLCLTYSTSCLEGLDSVQFSVGKTLKMIDQALEAAFVTPVLPLASGVA